MIVAGILILIVIYFSVSEYTKIVRKNVPGEERIPILTEMYKMVTKSESLPIKPFLTFGTLLGYYRERKIIPYDYDIDIGVFSEDYDLVKTYCKNLLKRNKDYTLRVEDFLWWKHFTIFHKRTGLNLDVNCFERQGYKVLTKVPSFFTKYIAGVCAVKQPSEWYLPLKKTRFLGKNIYVPNKPEKLLECVYGKDFMIPDHKCNKGLCKKI